MNRPLLTIVGGLALTGLGLFAGWYAARQGAVAADDAAHAHPQDAPLSEQALANLGVELGPVELTEHVHERRLAAVVADIPLTSRPLVAPYSGVVAELALQPGQVVRADQPVMFIVRDAIPRPELRYAGELLKPINEALHESFAALRAAVIDLKLNERELQRVRELNRDLGEDALPLVPRQTEIELGYAVERSRQKLEGVRESLRFHGLDAGAIAAVERGDHPPHARELWQRALEHHGLWSADVRRLHAAIAEPLRGLPWTIAVLGELAAAGVVDATLIEAFETDDALGARFHDVASLLLLGNDITRVELLVARGGIEPTFELRTPDDGALGAPDWDVVSVAVRPGEHVEAGRTVATIRDNRAVYLRIEPLGDEVAVLRAALEQGRTLRARPLVSGTGPELAGLQVERMTTVDGGPGSGGAVAGAGADVRVVAFVRCENRPVEVPDTASASAYRSWQLLPGQRYVVAVPTRTAPDPVFTMPRDAVTDLGPERVVFRKADDGELRPVPVQVVFEDDEVVAISKDSLTAGDVVARRGAFELSLALQARGQSQDHGHQH